MSDQLPVPSASPVVPSAALATPVVPTEPLLVPPAPLVPSVLIPEKPMMTKQTYSAAMSYVGSSRRIWAWTRTWGGGNIWLGLLAYTVMTTGVLIAWIVVTVWYFFTLVLFGWFMFPFRLIRRSHRKQEHLQRQQLATMQAMMIQQQQQLAQNQQKNER